MIILIDNYDSFAYNLYQFIGEFSKNILVFRNDEITVDEIKALKPKGIVISPGPGRPEESGVSIDIIKEVGKNVPILGVCLGHQVIGMIYGAKVIKNKEIVHGKISEVKHLKNILFKDIEESFNVMRYHSLVIDKKSITGDLEVISTLKDGTVMAIKHRERAIYGVQFHPESIGTSEGKILIRNFLKEICHEC